MNKILKLILGCALIFCTFSGIAGDVVKNARLDGVALYNPNSFLFVKYDKYALLPFPTNPTISINSSEGLIEFGIDDSKRIYHSNNFTSVLTLTYTTQNFSLTSSGTLTQTLVINYDPTQPYKGVANYKISNVAQINISKYSITTYTDYGLPSQATIASSLYPTAYGDLYLETSIKTNETIDFDCLTSLPVVSKIGKNVISSSGNPKALQAYWDYVVGAESYELEWIYIDDYDGSSGSTPITDKSSTSITYDFEHDATRVTTTNQYYEIPLVYEKGWILFRVRGIGRSITNNNVRLEGTWSNSGFASGTISSYTASQSYTIDPHETDKFNWVSSRTYAEDGKSGIGITYEDGLMKSRHSEAKLNTDDKVIVQSTLYDWQGRPTISVLPAPINQNFLGYKTNLNMSTSTVNIKFDKEIFDNWSLSTGTCGITGQVMSSTLSTGAANYYSSSNTDKDAQQGFIPEANGRPYVQVEYYPDQSGRIKKQSLPGNTHYLGSGKEQKYIYSQPTQEELVRLFGTEVGDWRKYQKTIQIDPNGQGSVTYLDDEGRVVATALTGTNPANLLPIPDATNTATPKSFSTSITNNNNDPANFIYGLSNSFAALQGQTHQISYDVTVSTYTDNCLPNLCLGCIYELELSIKDNCGNEMLDGDPITSGNQPINQILGSYNSTATPQFSTSCPSNTTALTFALSPNPFSFVAPADGSYSISKKLKLSQMPLTQYAMEFVKTSTCLATLSQYQTTALGLIDVTSCTSDCAACSTAVYSFSASLTTQQLNDMLDRCQLKCLSGDICKSHEKLLLMDFKPGQYFAKYDASKSNLTPTPAASAYSLSIFNSINQFSTVASAITPTAWYAAPDGSYGSYTTFDPAFTIPTASMVAPSALSVPNYISTYNDNFAKPWLKWHPEFCKLKFYCDPLITAIISYSNTMFNANSFADACALGILYPVSAATSWSNAPTGASCPNCTGISNVYMPLATFSGTSALSSQISSALTSYTNALLSTSYTGTAGTVSAGAYQVAIAMGSNLNLGDIVSGSITPVFGGDNCYRDKQWQMYKTLCMIQLNNLIINLMNTYISSWNNSDGGCLNTSSLNALPGYIVKFPDLNVMNNPIIASAPSTATTSTTTLLATAAGSLATQCASFCTGYVATWMSNLAPCNLLPADTSNIRQALEAICRLGCDASDPFGASNTYTAHIITIGTSTYAASNFQDVLTIYGYNPSATCNAYLISTPQPKGHSFSGSPTGIRNLDACGCDKILSTHQTYTSSVTTCTPTESSYFQSTLGITLPNLSSYVCACQAAATATAGIYTFTNVPADLQFLTLPAELACQNCIPCTALTNTSVVSSYTLLFGSTLPENVDPTILQNFYNNQLNMTNTAAEWISFIKDCNANYSGGSYGSSAGIAALTSQKAKDLGSLINTLYSNGFLSAGTNSLNTTNGGGFFSTAMWTNPSSWSTYIASVTQTVNVTTSVAGSVITVAIDNSPNATNYYSCTFQLNVPSALPSSPMLPPGLPSSGFYDIKGACWTHTMNVYSGGGVTTVTVTTPDAFVISFNALNTSSVLSTYTFSGNVSCFNTLTQPILSVTSPSCTPYLCTNLSTSTPTNNCIATLINNALNTAATTYSNYLTESIKTFTTNYTGYCYNNVIESTKRGYTLYEYHYTLYYYDRAGNLVHTVPPASVSVITNTTTISNAITYINSIGTSGSPVYPAHSLNDPTGIDHFVSHYQYNTFDAPVLQVTPDGGETNYLYDYVGRLVASQNAKQAADKSWSYTLYDALGRITEVGVVLLSPTDVLSQSITVNPTAWPAYVTSRSRQEVTQSYYDLPVISALNSQFSGGQLNLHNRVSATTYEWAYDGNNATYDHATAFSYDDHGNVTHIVKQNPDLNYAGSNNEFKHIEYQYDLISGNVKTIAYQRGERDQFYHKYYYDADNRLHEVETSGDGQIYTRDAKYFYYQHGPLARTEIGEKQVQGIDYTYTIPGWVKAINSTILSEVNDPGKDASINAAYIATTTANPGNVNRLFAKDAASYALNYFGGDYTAIKTFTGTTNFLADMSVLSSTAATGFNMLNDGTDLYNGNISSMVTSINDINVLSPDLGMVKPQITAYRYDQLHRIKRQKAFSSLQSVYTSTVSPSRYSEAINLATNAWITPTNTANYVGIYQMAFNYDGLGNITNLQRAGEATFSSTWTRKIMDDMTYSYYNSAGITIPSLSTTINSTNRLKVVNENSVTTSSLTYSFDIDNQTNVNNYTYNGIGSLTGDASEEIQTIAWTDAHKIKSITRTSTSTKADIEYEYDELARRISKTVKMKTVTGALDPNNVWKTYYILDADGNVLTTLEEHIVPGVIPTIDLTEKEKYVYGSDRIGALNSNMDLYNPILSGALNYVNLYYGNKDYELENHLGNVITTVSDRKKAIDGTFTYLGNGLGNQVFNGSVFTPTTSGNGNYFMAVTPDNKVDYYVPDVKSVNDYYAFGMVMPGRNYATAASDYRFGFNGKEHDLKSGFDDYDYGARMYDPRLGRFLSEDPLTLEYPFYTPYQFAGNTPITFIDRDGEEPGKPQIIETNYGVVVLQQPNGYTLEQILQELRKPLSPKPPVSSKAPFVLDRMLLTLGFVLMPLEIGQETPHGFWEEFQRKMDRRLSTSNSLEIFTTDPSTLPDEYLMIVRQRLLNGTATEQDKQYESEVQKRIIGANDKYIVNPQHDPKSNKYKTNKSVLPDNHDELWEKRSYYDSDKDEWWSVEGEGKKAVYHRFKGNQGEYHWNGSSNGRTKAGRIYKILKQHIPNKVTKPKVKVKSVPKY